MAENKDNIQNNEMKQYLLNEGKEILIQVWRENCQKNIFNNIMTENNEKIHKYLQNYLQGEGKNTILEICKEIVVPTTQLNRQDSEVKSKLQRDENKENGNELEKNTEPEDVVTKDLLYEYFKEFDDVIRKEDSAIDMLKALKRLLKRQKQEQEQLKEDHKKEKEILEGKENKLKNELKGEKQKKSELEEQVKELKNTIKNLNQDNSILKTQLKQQLEKSKQLEQEKETIHNKKLAVELAYDTQKKQLQDIQVEKMQLQKRLDRLASLETLQTIYEKYLMVSEKKKEDWKNLIRYEDMDSFLACCYRINTMNDLWDAVNQDVKNNNYDDMEQLNEIFEYFILQQNKYYEDSIYRIINPQIGEQFDPTKHMPVNGKSSGMIEKVVFFGYGELEGKTSQTQLEEERKIKKVKKLAMVYLK